MWNVVCSGELLEVYVWLLLSLVSAAQPMAWDHGHGDKTRNADSASRSGDATAASADDYNLSHDPPSSLSTSSLCWLISSLQCVYSPPPGEGRSAPSIHVVQAWALQSQSNRPRLKILFA